MPLTADVSVKRRVSTQAVASAERRAHILDTAVEAFRARGFHGASMRDIAARAGMSHTGVLHHFPDKTALLEAVLDRHIGRAAADVRLDPSDGLVFLRGLVALTERDVSAPGDLAMYCVVAAEALSPEHPAHGYFVHWYAEVRASVRTALADLRDRGRYRPADLPIDVAAVQIASLRDGLNQQWLLAPAEVDLVGAVRAQLQTYVVDEL